MSKIFAYIVIVPLLSLILFKAIAFYENETKQRYLKEITDNLADEVRITGHLSEERYSDFKSRFNRLALFEDENSNPDNTKGIFLRKGSFLNGSIQQINEYQLGDRLFKGDYFMVYIKSSDVTNFSRLENLGINPDDSKNLYYVAKAECRVEYVDVYQ
jgi:hypothetical protein